MGSFPLLILLLTGAQDPQQLVPTSAPANTSDSSDPITPIGRLDWTVKSTIGPASLWIGVFDAGWGTAFNHPKEYGRSFDGFAERYGLRISTVALSNTLEAGMGGIWGEDPRYRRTEGSARGRFKHALQMTVMAERSDGSVAPAYARYIGFTGANVLSNAWRPDSDRTAGNTMERIGERFAGRFAANLWEEFWPDLKKHMFWNKH